MYYSVCGTVVSTVPAYYSVCGTIVSTVPVYYSVWYSRVNNFGVLQCVVQLRNPAYNIVPVSSTTVMLLFEKPYRVKYNCAQ